MQQTTALISTIRVVDQNLKWWLAYHRELFSKILLFIDDPAQQAEADAIADNQIIVIAGDQTLHPHVDGLQGRAMVRQERNTMAAIDYCRAHDIEWLCHLDDDEILYISKDHLDEAFGCKCNQLVFINLEVFPRWNAENAFTECLYFKMNGEYPFNFYGNGKAAARISSDPMPAGAHRFACQSEHTEVVNTGVVLHYSCATYNMWIDKYKNLGRFSDFWWDDKQHPIVMPFHLQSRDCISACIENGDYAPAVELWRTQVKSDSELEELAQQGFAVRLRLGGV